MTRGHEWSAGVGNVWAEQWQRTDRTFATMAAQLDIAIDRVVPPPGGRVADIGFGAGATSLSLARGGQIWIFSASISRRSWWRWRANAAPICTT